MNEPTDRPIRRYIAWIIVALLVVVADQATKWAIIEWIELYGRVPINSFVNLTSSSRFSTERRSSGG